MPAARPHATWCGPAHGRGEIFRTTVFSKLLGLALIKFATLDPLGMGIEMEAGKPGWCDALNGLPGLFGSSMSETYELLRLLDFLLADAGHAQSGEDVEFPSKLADLLRQVVAQLTAYHLRTADGERDFRYWDAVASAREAYRARVRLGFDGRTETLTFAVLAPILQAFRDKVAAGHRQSRGAHRRRPAHLLHLRSPGLRDCLDRRSGEPLRDDHGPALRAREALRAAASCPPSWKARCTP